jgi:hypothetical protein
MTQDDSKLIAASAVGCGLGLYLFFKGFREFREYRVVADTPVIPIRSVPMGLVQIRGQAKSGQTVTSPVSHTPCYWYRVVIERWERDSKGRGGHWAHAHTDTDGVKFYLADATGHIQVDAQNAEFDLPQTAQRKVSHGSSFRVGSGATDEELLRYVTKAGVHSFGKVIGSGIQHLHPLADPAQEEKRQMLAGALQATPGSPEFMQRMMPLMAPMMKRSLESMGAQGDPRHEQARQAALAAFGQHEPGSPEFMQAIQSAVAMSGESPEKIAQFQKFLHPGNDLEMFSAASGQYRLTESCIVPDGTYDITGTCTENPSPADEHDRNMIAKGQNEPTFLISSKSEKQLESGLRRRAAGKIFGGAALAIVCLAIVLAKLGLLF